ncbi:MAG: oxidoreductase [Rhodobacteraceae bacterium]|nr:oxidoreductase [Paracoccaceae bacterium]
MTAYMNLDISYKFKTVIVAGATGYIGQYVCKTLVSRGHRVITIGRSTPPAQDALIYRNINVEVCSRADIEVIKGSIPRIDVVISCLGSRSGGRQDSWLVELDANKNLLSLAQSGHAEQFVLLSAICVQKPRLEFQFAKLAFEEVLVASGMPFTIVRPTAYFKSLAGQIENVKAGKPFCVFDNGTRTACKPISGRDLALFMCDCIELPEKLNKILPIGGPGPSVSLKEQGEMIFRLIDKPCRIRQIPSGAFSVIGTLMAPLGFFSQRLSDKQEFLRIAHYYATESMLFWDRDAKRYSAEKTPEYGSDTLESFYKQVINSGLKGHELGEQKFF